MPIELVRIYRTRGVWEDTRGRNSRVASKDKLPLKRLDNRDLYLRLVAHAMIGAASQDSLDLLERKRPEWTALTSGVGHFSVQMVTLSSAQDDCTTPFAIPLVLDGRHQSCFLSAISRPLSYIEAVADLHTEPDGAVVFARKNKRSDVSRPRGFEALGGCRLPS